MLSIVEYNGKEERIKKKILPFVVWTVELEQVASQAREYFGVHNYCARSLYAGMDEEVDEARMEIRYYRRLVHATACNGRLLSQWPCNA